MKMSTSFIRAAELSDQTSGCYWRRPLCWYSLAIFVSLVAPALRLTIEPSLCGVRFLIVLPLVMFVTFFGGLGPGLVMTALSSIGRWVSLVIGQTDASHYQFWAQEQLLLAYVCLTTLVAFAVAGARQSREREAMNQRLRDELAHRQRLESRICQLHKTEALGPLSAGFAHDLNNTLAVVIGQVDRAERACADRANVTAMLAAIKSAGERAERLVKTVLTVGQEHSPTPDGLDVNQVLELLVLSLRTVLPQHLRLLFERVPELWPTLADRALLEAAVTNLIFNARDAVPSLGGEIVISAVNVGPGRDQSIVGLKPGDYIMITVTDNGKGIPENVRARVFDPYFTTKEGEGSGLGLAMVRGFTQEAGGAVTLDSVLGQGTAVHLYLPRAE
jgi:signal transduction histidine kinase